MNLPEFLKKTDAIAERLTKEQLSGMIHQIARTLPEERRNEFLKLLCTTAEIQNPEQVTAQEDSSFSEDLKTTVSQCLEKLKSIQRGTLCLESDINYDYYDDYDNEEMAFLFEDPENILDIIRKSCESVHQCVDAAFWSEAYQLGKMILNLEVAVNGEYVDYVDSTMNISDLVSYELLPACDILSDTLCAAYQALPMLERPAVFYALIQKSNCHGWKLEELMQYTSQELTQMPEFLSCWISYLGNVKEQDAEQFLYEAVKLQNDAACALYTAETFVIQHPGLFEQVMLMQKNDIDLLAVGREALQKIHINYTIRGRIALMTADCAFRLGMQTEAEQFLIEAFRSDSTLENYFRILLESQEFMKYQPELYKICTNVSCYEYEKTGYFPNLPESLNQNYIRPDEYEFFTFLNGDFQAVLKKMQKKQKSAFWEQEFMKYGFAMFCLYLYPDTKLKRGCQYLCDHLKKHFHIPDEIIWKGLQKHRNLIPIPEEFKPELMQKLQNLLAFHTEQVMEYNRRGQYQECAAFAAALGEILNSDGTDHAKQEFLLAYKTKYNRRTAFHRELRAFGMKDGKK